MGIRRRGYDIAAFVRNHAADKAARDEAVRVVERWNADLAAGRDALWSPTIRAAIVAGTPWLDVYCPGCRTSRAIGYPHHRPPPAGVGRKPRDIGLRCSWCPGSAPMPKITGLHALPPAAGVRESAG